MARFDDAECFDEESARYFLREVGARVVPNYPFSYGMEEVNSLIVEEYGYDYVPDVWSVLQELLEEDDTASGLGDDGDVWRPWRYPWRHRNDNALDPWVAKVGNFILQQPTSKALRRIRADNFLRKIERDQFLPTPSALAPHTSSRKGSPSHSVDHRSHTGSSRRSKEARKDNGELLTSATYSHQRCRYMLSVQSQNRALETSVRESAVSNDLDSQQDFAEVTASMLNDDFDASWLLSFEMLEPGASFPIRDSSLRGGDLAPIYTLQAVSDKPKVSHVDAADARDSVVYTNGTDKTSPVRAPLEPGINAPVPDYGHEIQDTEQEGKDVDVISKEKSDGHHPGNTTCVTPTQTPEPQRRRTAHRHARLIDGAIFPFKGRKSNAARSSVDVQEHLSPDAGKRSLFRLSWTPTRQKSQSRSSWLQGFKSIFRTSSNKSQQPHARHRHNSSLGTIADAPLSMSHPRQTLIPNNSNSVQGSRRYNFGLDGTSDDLPSPSSSPLNKPLPLTPIEIVHRLSSGTPSKSNSVGQSQTFSHQPHSASTSSTKISQVSSKHEFRAIARDLASADGSTMYHPELSPVREVRLDPLKYDPSKPPETAHSSMSFSSLAHRNPFTEDLVPLTPRPRKSIDGRRQQDTSSYHSYGLPPSQSEPNLRPLSPIKPSTAAYYTPPNLPQTPPPSSPERSRSRQDSSRGRSKTRQTAEQEEDVYFRLESISPRKHVKRSRSPVKRLLGIGKTPPPLEPSSSPRQEPKTPTAHEPKTPTAATSKKSSLKHWGDKFRHGFLANTSPAMATSSDNWESADQEEVRREAEIEEYMATATEPEPPSSFPISLDPAYQARLQADIELLICVSANKFLLHEAKAGRISKDTVNRIRRSWESRNLPQVLEYHYDQTTQRELILANFRTVQFQGQFRNDFIALNSTMLSWDTLAKEMSIRTFCSADSAIKKQLHDAQRVLEMLGSPLVTCLAFEQLHIKALEMMTKCQKERFARKKAQQATKGHTRNISGVSNTSRKQHGPYPRRDYSEKSQYIPHHRRELSEGSLGEIKGATQESVEDKIARMNVTPMPPAEIMMRKAIGASVVVTGSQNSSPTPSRGHRYHGSLGGQDRGY